MIKKSVSKRLRTLATASIPGPITLKSPVLAMALISMLSTTLNAQQTPEKVTELEEMVVTATKREDLLQEVPIAVTVLDGQMLNDLGFWDSGDIAAQIPNLQWRSDFGTSSPNIFLRGIGSA